MRLLIYIIICFLYFIMSPPLLLAQAEGTPSEAPIEIRLPSESSPSSQGLRVLEKALLEYKLEPQYLDELIRRELDSINTLLEEIAVMAKAKGLEGRVEDNGTGFINKIGALATIGISDPTGQHSEKFKILYTYDNSDYIIKVISIYKNDDLVVQFPELFAITDRQYDQLYTVLRGADNSLKIELLSAYLENVHKSLKYGIWWDYWYEEYLARYHGNLSWYYILENQGTEALHHAQKGLQLYKEDTRWIKVNLLLSHFLKGDTEEGLRIYEQIKLEKHKDKSIQEMLEKDIQILTKKGISIPNRSTILEAIRK